MEIDGLVPDFFGDFRNRGQTLLDGTDVKAGATDENRQPPRSRRHRDLIECQRAPVSDRTALGSIEKAVEPMRRSLFGGRVGTRRQHAEIAIDLSAIGIYDGSVEGLRQLKRERRFAARSRTGDDEDAGRAVSARAPPA